MRDRLKEFMESKALSAKQFAEQIEVQASSVSHILTGRNKPSIDFIEKLLKAFPDIDIKYLLTGVNTAEDRTDSTSFTRESLPLDTGKKTIKNEETTVESTNVNSSLEVKEIVSLYDDGTFKIYRPKK